MTLVTHEGVGLGVESLGRTEQIAVAVGHPAVAAAIAAAREGAKTTPDFGSYVETPATERLAGMLPPAVAAAAAAATSNEIQPDFSSK